MSWIPFAVMVLIFGIGLWAAIRIARAFQRGIDAANKKAAEAKKKPSPYHWVWSSFHWIWVGVIPAAKYVYREWKTAPKDSAEKFFWTMVLAAVVAAAIWILIKILDRIIYRETKPATQPESARIR